MKAYISCILGNFILGICSQIPVLYGVVMLQGGLRFFGPPLKPTLQESIFGWGTCLIVLLVLIFLNVFLYRRFRQRCQHPKLLVLVGVLSFVAGLFSFAIGIIPPDIFDLV